MRQNDFKQEETSPGLLGNLYYLLMFDKHKQTNLYNPEHVFITRGIC